MVSGLRGEDSIAELCRREGIAESLYYSWSKEFLEAGKKRLSGDTARQASSGEVKDLRREMHCPSSKHLGHLGLFLNGGSGSSWLMLSRLVVMGQAAFFDGQVFDLSPSLDDTSVPCRREREHRDPIDRLVVLVGPEGSGGHCGAQRLWTPPLVEAWPNFNSTIPKM